MTFFTKKDIGRVYVIRIELPDGNTIHKIGMTHSNRSVDRMMEIARSWFNHYRYLPYMELKLDMECLSPYKLEQFLHKIFASKQCSPDSAVDGYSEMFHGIDEFRLLHYIKSFNTDYFANPLDLAESDYLHLCELLCPEN